VRERARELESHHRESLRRALAAGVRIAAGTDAGGHAHPANAIELDCLVRAGMTPGEAIRAATGWGAECLGLERDIGTIEKGKLADLVAVAGDPLAEISCLQDAARIALVVKGGAIVARRPPLASSAGAPAPR
jgi:imidazolonepropionase-like amidohydrolase